MLDSVTLQSVLSKVVRVSLGQATPSSVQSSESNFGLSYTTIGSVQKGREILG